MLTGARVLNIAAQIFSPGIIAERIIIKHLGKLFLSGKIIPLDLVCILMIYKDIADGMIIAIYHKWLGVTSRQHGNVYEY
jgi:hypothetical protein